MTGFKRLKNNCIQGSKIDQNTSGLAVRKGLENSQALLETLICTLLAEARLGRSFHTQNFSFNKN